MKVIDNYINMLSEEMSSAEQENLRKQVSRDCYDITWDRVTKHYSDICDKKYGRSPYKDKETKLKADICTCKVFIYAEQAVIKCLIKWRPKCGNDQRCLYTTDQSIKEEQEQIQGWKEKMKGYQEQLKRYRSER